jgi:hypothetical protein
LGLPAGSEVDLGTLDVSSVRLYNQYGDDFYLNPIYSLTGTYLTIGPGPAFGGCHLTNSCPTTIPPSVSIPLIFPSDADVQLSFIDGVIIPAPVPEPTTWAMLLIGFAGIGFAGYRRRLSPARNGYGKVSARRAPNRRECSGRCGGRS